MAKHIKQRATGNVAPRADRDTHPIRAVVLNVSGAAERPSGQLLVVGNSLDAAAPITGRIKALPNSLHTRRL